MPGGRLLGSTGLAFEAPTIRLESRKPRSVWSAFGIAGFALGFLDDGRDPLQTVRGCSFEKSYSIDERFGALTL
jgi:hypothetical protein